MLIASLASFADITVSGVVSDPQGEPLIGASIKEKGSAAAAITNFDGMYSIKVKDDATLEFSYVGFETKEIKVTGPSLDVTLSESQNLLDEVVVVGYGTMRRKDVTGSISTINSKDLNVGAYTDPGQLLQGKVPGLVVVQNSDPNGGVNSMTLRGASTLNGSTASLYVVDGIPGVELNLISPNDIESIDVLRDASATAIYGSKAANGVIIVTTSTPDEKDRVIVGNAQPWLTMGWDNKITWRNWDLNLFFTGVFGQKIFDEPRAYLSYIGNIALGKNVLSSIITDQNAHDNYSSMPSDRYLEDGSYFKLNTVTLGYTFRNCFNGWLNDLRLYVSCNNVFTITKYKGRDPEINLGGLEPGHDSRNDHFPRTRQVLVGATINF